MLYERDKSMSTALWEFLQHLVFIFYQRNIKTYFSTEDTCVLGMLCDFHLLNHFSKWGTIASTILSCNSNLLGSFRLERQNKPIKSEMLRNSHTVNLGNNMAITRNHLFISMAMISWNNRRISTHHFWRFHRVMRRGEREPYGNFSFLLYLRLRAATAVKLVRRVRPHENNVARGTNFGAERVYVQIFSKMSKKSEEEGKYKRNESFTC